MTAGLNVYFDIYRMQSSSDDEVGGAQITGTLLHERVPGRLTAQETEPLLLQQSGQGAEFSKIFIARVKQKFPDGLDVKEQDELELIEPYNHHYKGSRFRIIEEPTPSLHPSDRRGTLRMTVTRSEYAHANQ